MLSVTQNTQYIIVWYGRKQSWFILRHLALLCLDQQRTLQSENPTRNIQGTKTLPIDVVFRNNPLLSCQTKMWWLRTLSKYSASEVPKLDTWFRWEASHWQEMIIRHIVVEWIDQAVANSVLTAVRAGDSVSWRKKRLLASQLVLW